MNSSASASAPCAACDGCDQKQAEARHDEQARDVIEFLRPDFDEEEIEAAIGEVDQHGLIGRIRPAIPAQPRREIIDAQRDEHDEPFEAPELTANTLRKNLDPRRIERLPGLGGIHCLNVDAFDLL